MTFFSLLADVLPVPVLWMATLAAAGTSDGVAKLAASWLALSGAAN